MVDIYNRSVLERNDVKSVPSGYIDGTANDLFRFLGSFWTNIHEGRPFVEGLQKIRGIKLAQRYLDLLETLKLQDRKGLPVFHRELWHPLIIRKSMRNKSKSNELKIGEGNIVLGDNTGSKYGAEKLYIGKLANLDKYVTYPVESDIVTVVSGITDNVINPKVSWTVGDGENDIRYMNGTIIIPKEMDPFGDNSPFESYDLPDFIDGTKESDRETVLWASDVLIDKDYVSDHMAYALGVSCASTDLFKRVLNAVWDAFSGGLTPEFLRSILAALLNTPVIQESEETVRMVTSTSEVHTIVTDKHTYNVYGKAKLRSCVKAGEKLYRGDLLDESVKVYPFLTDLNAEHLQAITEYAGILGEDIPVISLPKTILSTRTAHGLNVDWTPTEVLTAGTDKNGHQKLFFELGGPEEDVEAFWADVWKNAEDQNIDLSDYFEEYKEDSGSDSSDEVRPWMVIPADFFLRYLVGGNTLIVTLDHAQIEDASMIHDARFFDLLSAAVPSGIRLFFVEHLAPANDAYDLGPETEDGAEKFAFVEADEDEFDYDDLPGMKGKHRPSYDDEVEMKFLRNRKRSAE